MKLPKQSKKVFSGILFDVYQWKQKIYNGNYKTFEKIIRKACVDVIATIDNQIVVLMQEQPTKPLFPSLPGGKVERGQTPLSAAKAELLQETGCKAMKFRLWKEFYGSSKLYFHESLFIANDCQKTAKQDLDGGERIKVTLKNFDDFLQLCRNQRFTAPQGLKFIMYEALLDPKKKKRLKKQIFGF